MRATSRDGAGAVGMRWRRAMRATSGDGAGAVGTRPEVAGRGGS